MQSILVIPLRSISDSKSRLADLKNKTHFTKQCINSLVSAASKSNEISDTVLVSGSNEVKNLANQIGVEFFYSDRDLNGALKDYRSQHIISGNDTAIINCLGDLPLITEFDATTASLDTNDIVIGCDRHGSGTNILALHNSFDWKFQFGSHSFQHHIHQANRSKLKLKILREFAMGLDIDTMQDYEMYLESTLGGK